MQSWSSLGNTRRGGSCTMTSLIATHRQTTMGSSEARRWLRMGEWSEIVTDAVFLPVPEARGLGKVCVAPHFPGQGRTKYIGIRRLVMDVNNDSVEETVARRVIYHLHDLHDNISRWNTKKIWKLENEKGGIFQRTNEVVHGLQNVCCKAWLYLEKISGKIQFFIEMISLWVLRKHTKVLHGHTVHVGFLGVLLRAQFTQGMWGLYFTNQLRYNRRGWLGWQISVLQHNSQLLTSQAEKI